MRHLAILLLAIASSLPAYGAAAMVEVVLASGERAYGALVSDDQGTLVMERWLWSPRGVVNRHSEFARGRVTKVLPVASLADLYRQHADETPDTFDGQYTLVRWCADRGL